jgi:YfiH family protein
MPNELMAPQFLQPGWPAPPGVQALMTLRGGGHSAPPFDGFNLSRAVGDDPQAVAANRALFVQRLGGARPTWLRQVHGVDVLRLTPDTPEHPETTADAAWTDQPGLACMVSAADCMPVLLALRDGTAVAAAHAGWRGLAGGVLEATVQALCEGTGRPADELQAWLGPCIGPRQFEVGADVLQAFGQNPEQADPALFVSRPRPDGAPRWLAHLPALAQRRLRALGLRQIDAAAACTVEDASRFFSYRRDRITGRMFAAIWRR